MQYIALCGAAVTTALILKWYFRGARCDCKSRLDNRIVIITGGNSGIGYQTALDLAKRGAEVILACRNAKIAEEAAEKIRQLSSNTNVHVELVDLSSFSSIKKFATNIENKYDRIDILINNAGMLATARELTEDGLEKTLAVNHLGHFLLTNLLLKLLLKSQQGRVVTVSSVAYKAGTIDWDDMTMAKNFTPLKAYARSKLANILFTHELAKRLKGTKITTYSVHPGTVGSQLIRDIHSDSMVFHTMIQLLRPFSKLFVKTTEEGAQTTIHAAVNEELSKLSGVYLSDCKVTKLLPKAISNEDSEHLWQYSEEVLKDYL